MNCIHEFAWRNLRQNQFCPRIFTKFKISFLSSAVITALSFNAHAVLLIDWVSVGDAGNTAGTNGKPIPPLSRHLKQSSHCNFESETTMKKSPYQNQGDQAREKILDAARVIK
jgi:hypothetical protein